LRQSVQGDFQPNILMAFLPFSLSSSLHLLLLLCFSHFNLQRISSLFFLAQSRRRANRKHLLLYRRQSPAAAAAALSLSECAPCFFLDEGIRQNRFDNQLFLFISGGGSSKIFYFLFFLSLLWCTTQPKKKSCLCLIPETHLSRWALFWRPRFVLKPDHPQPPKRVCVCVCIYIGSFHFSFSLLSAASITHKQLEKKAYILFYPPS
jgi:hypothetical protein